MKPETVQFYNKNNKQNESPKKPETVQFNNKNNKQNENPMKPDICSKKPQNFTTKDVKCKNIKR